MKFSFLILLCMLQNNNYLTVFDFHKNSNLNSWHIVDDVVMGGVSTGKFYLSEEGTGVFTGVVSLKNNGGFSSVRHQFKPLDVSSKKNAVLYLKGDGKSYQFRIKDNVNNYFSYIYTFKTSGQWETIKIPLQEMYPSFRGRKLSLLNFSASTIQEISLLIANKKEEAYKLELDKIGLE